MSHLAGTDNRCRLKQQMQVELGVIVPIMVAVTQQLAIA